MEENGTELTEDILEVSEFPKNPTNKTSNNNISFTPSGSDKLRVLKNNKPSKSYLYKKLGNTFSFFGNKNGDPLFIIGPNWRLYICFSLSSSLLYFFIFVTFWNFINITPKIIGITIYSIFFLSYTYTFLINPGYPKNDINFKTPKQRNKYLYCKSCKIWVSKEKNVSHCVVCDICIEEYDHHCIWTSKCIGKNNINSFNIFVIFTFISIIYSMVILYLAKFSYLYLEK